MILRVMLYSLIVFCGVFASSLSFAADVLCPELDEAKRDTPGDVAGVQADIERLNLCVERAKLLKQLDDLAKQRAETLRKVTNPATDYAVSGSFPGGLQGNGGIPALPVSSLPSLPDQPDTENLKPGEVRIRNAGGAPLEGSSTHAVGFNWKIRKIWGQAGGVAGAVMRAQLSDGNGTLLNVAKGDPLPDGKVVESVSIKGVALSQNGKINDLSWDAVTDDVSVETGSINKNDNKTSP